MRNRTMRKVIFLLVAGYWIGAAVFYWTGVFQPPDWFIGLGFFFLGVEYLINFAYE